MGLLQDIFAYRDWLNRGAALGTLHHVIETVHSPSCIALYGSWGTGKTSLLRQAQRRWDFSSEEKNNARVKNRAIWFDTWEHDQRGDLVSPLMWTIAKHASGWNQDASKAIAKIAIQLGKMALTLGAQAGLAFGAKQLDELLGMQKVLDDWKPDRVVKFFEDPERYANQVEETKKQFYALVEAALENTARDSRLVIFLDDLDRCLPETVVTLLEAIKLLLCVGHGNSSPRVVFVFGLDRTIVGEAIAKRYPGSSFYTGESYLEKIFDVSLEVPPVGRPDLPRFLALQRVPAQMQRALPDMSPTEAEAVLEEARATLETEFAFVGGYAALERTLLLPAFANPRVIKRCINRLLLLKAGEDAARRAVEGAARRAVDRAKAEDKSELEQAAAATRARAGFSSTAELLGTSVEAQDRLLLWIAGAERFRGFRYAFMEASPAEVQAFHMTCFPTGAANAGSADVPARLGDGLKRVMGTPGFLKFYEKLVGTGVPATQVPALRGEERENAAQIPLIGEIDRHLRGYGV